MSYHAYETANVCHIGIYLHACMFREKHYMFREGETLFQNKYHISSTKSFTLQGNNNNSVQHTEAILFFLRILVIKMCKIYIPMNISVLSIVPLRLCTILRIRPEIYRRGLADMKLFTLDTLIIRVSYKNGSVST